MKKLLLIGSGLALITMGGLSMYDTTSGFSKYHSDGIDGVDAVNYTANPPVEKTGAPFESNCTDCHAGTTSPAAGTVDFTLSGLGTGYYPGQTYPVTIGSTSGTKNGFQLVAVDATDAQAGTFTAGTNSNISSASARDYVRHTSAVGATTWNFMWDAPATDLGDITFYYSYNISDETGTTANDEIYLGSLVVPVAGDVSIDKNAAIEESYTVSYSPESNTVLARYATPDNKRIFFHIQSLNGQVVKRLDLGYQAPGEYQETIELDEINADGIYIVSLFIGNDIFSKKLFVGR